MSKAPKTGAGASASSSGDGVGARLDRLFRVEAPRLHRFFWQKTGDREAASDLVQDAFVRLAAVQVQQLANPAAYLQRIARNMVIDRFRGRRSKEALLLPLEDQDVAVPPVQENDIAASDLLRLYETAVDGMNEKTRVVFLLSRVEGLTYDEIRQRLHISMGTVEYHMMRAIAHVDRVIGDR